MYAVPGPSWEAEGLLKEQRKAGQETCKGGSEQWQVSMAPLFICHLPYLSFPPCYPLPEHGLSFLLVFNSLSLSQHTLFKAHCYDLVWQIHTVIALVHLVNIFVCVAQKEWQWQWGWESWEEKTPRASDGWVNLWYPQHLPKTLSTHSYLLCT